MKTPSILGAILATCAATLGATTASAQATAEVPLAAVAVLEPTKGSEARGIVHFEQTEQGVGIRSDVEGLTPGSHGYHVHLYGDCTAPDASSAGTHYNFEGPSDPPPQGIQRITGNLGNLDAGQDGRAKHEARIALATLHGPKSIVGRSVVVHEKPNDPASPPIGAAGGRVACGVIGIAEAPGNGAQGAGAKP